MEDIIRIAEQFNIEEIIKLSEYGKGRINETFLIETVSTPGERNNPKRYILQKLHRIINYDVLKDIEIITNFLEKKGFITPKLISTHNGDLGVFSGRDIWRMLTFIPGTTFEKVINRDMAEDAASLFGRFHSALIDLNYEFLHTIPNFHNTDAIIERLKDVSHGYKGTYKYTSLFPLTERVLIEYKRVDKSFLTLPDRIIHGDPKINNVRFDEKGGRATSLLDLDTLGKNKIIIDIGDAVRSWCFYADESDKKEVQFNLEIFESMMSGYLSSAFFMTDAEIESIPQGVELMILELSARYIMDAFEESYFKLDPEEFPTLYEQNKTKAISQIYQYDDFQMKRKNIDQIIETYS